MEIVGNHLVTKTAMIHRSLIITTIREPRMVYIYTNDGHRYDIDMELGSKNSYEDVSYWLIKDLIRTRNHK